MVDFAAKIQAQKAKDKKRAGKRSRPVTGDKMPRMQKAPIPSAKRRKDSTGAIMKGLTDLFKGTPDPGISGAYDMPGVYDFTDNIVGGFKKGGRLKKAGKRKRAALRGQRSELRGS
tara:strand:+ start:526 stop:873 length:348 start_codon:yes stop_codon:yes gene_type:complete